MQILVFSIVNQINLQYSYGWNGNEIMSREEEIDPGDVVAFYARFISYFVLWLIISHLSTHLLLAQNLFFNTSNRENLASLEKWQIKKSF